MRFCAVLPRCAESCKFFDFGIHFWLPVGASELPLLASDAWMAVMSSNEDFASHGFWDDAACVHRTNIGLSYIEYRLKSDLGI